VFSVNFIRLSISSVPHICASTIDPTSTLSLPFVARRVSCFGFARLLRLFLTSIHPPSVSSSSSSYVRARTVVVPFVRCFCGYSPIGSSTFSICSMCWVVWLDVLPLITCHLGFASTTLVYVYLYPVFVFSQRRLMRRCIVTVVYIDQMSMK